MDWSDAVVNGIDVTGRITSVISHDGEIAKVVLNGGIMLQLETSHLPVKGDWVVEGELVY